MDLIAAEAAPTFPEKKGRPKAAPGFPLARRPARGRSPTRRSEAEADVSRRTVELHVEVEVVVTLVLVELDLRVRVLRADTHVLPREVLEAQRSVEDMAVKRATV